MQPVTQPHKPETWTLPFVLPFPNKHVLILSLLSLQSIQSSPFLPSLSSDISNLEEFGLLSLQFELVPYNSSSHYKQIFLKGKFDNIPAMHNTFNDFPIVLWMKFKLAHKILHNWPIFTIFTSLSPPGHLTLAF